MLGKILLPFMKMLPFEYIHDSIFLASVSAEVFRCLIWSLNFLFLHIKSKKKK